MKSTINRLLALVLISMVAFFMPGCGSSDDDNDKVTLSDVVVVTVNNKTVAEVPVGAEGQFKAIAVYSDGSEKDVTKEAKWYSSDPSVAKVDKAGYAEAIKRGETTINADYGSITGESIPIIVTHATITELAIEPEDANLSKGKSLQFKAVATLSNGKYLPVSAVAEWSSSDDKIASVVKGNVYANEVGSVTITAEYKGHTISTPLTVTQEPMDQEDAKNAMALNGMAYRVLVPVYSTIRNNLQDDAVTNGLVYPDCDSGTFERNASRDGKNKTVTFTFHQCKTTQPNTGFQNKMIAECGAMALKVLMSSSSVNTNEGNSYYAIIDGNVTCEIYEDGKKGRATFDNYVVTAHNSTVQDPDGDNQWSYNMTVDVAKIVHEDQEDGHLTDAVYLVGMDGVVEGKKWDGSSDGSGTLVDHEKWIFEDFELEGDHQGTKGDTLRAHGKLAYEGIIREGDNANNGMKLYLGFDHFEYFFKPLNSTSEDIEVTVSGKVNASCHPSYASFETIEKMEDYNATRDLNNDRMPSKGTVNVTLDDKDGTAVSVFASNGTNAEFTTTLDNIDQTYDSWKSVIQNSSCEKFQEIIDRYLPPLLP